MHSQIDDIDDNDDDNDADADDVSIFHPNHRYKLIAYI